MGTRQRRLRRFAKVGLPAVGLAAAMTAAGAGQGIASADPATATQIKHLVVIFGENISFDHYFGTYPNAANPNGEPQFTPAPGTANTPGSTQTINNLATTAGAGGTGTLLTNNPNTATNPTTHVVSQANPARLDRTSTDVMTCSQNHSYMPEQKAFDGGLMDKFPDSVGTTGSGVTGRACATTDNMDYYDGNTVTAMWNYAQHDALSDNNFDTIFGPSTPGALDITSGNTDGVDTSKLAFGATTATSTSSALLPDGHGGFTIAGDIRPYYDDCNTSAATALTGQNIGDLLNAKGISWGWFQGGFKPTTAATTTSDPTGAYNPATETGKAVCNAQHVEGTAVGGSSTSTADYIQHHEPFNFYASTANPHHLAPTSLAAIGTDTQDYNSSGQPTFDTANHNYDMSDFDSLVSAIAHGNTSLQLPAVSYLKAPAYEDAHAGYSDPLDEQAFVTKEINALEQTPDWSSTAVILDYDDSDGWYDHVEAAGFPQHGSNTVQDLTQCSSTAPADGTTGKCGYGPRLPLLVISPYAKSNYIDHTLVNQASVVKFIEDNWLSGQRISGSADATSGSINSMFDFNNGGSNPVMFLDPTTGEPTSIPVPNLPESHLAVELLASGGAVLVVGAAFLARRRRRGPSLAL